MFLFAAVALVVVLAVILVWPHFVQGDLVTNRSGEGKVGALLDERERVLQTIKDLEFDFQTGKVSEDDYATLKLRSAEELGKVLSELDAAPGR